jgi:hypothetical protein
LGIEPCDRAERARWYTFLGKLKDYESDVPNVNGYNRVIVAFVDVHAMAKDPRVTFSEGHPLIFSVQPYKILSIPTKPGQVARQEAADAAKERREKSKK